jgi:hypothetical protein
MTSRASEPGERVATIRVHQLRDVSNLDFLKRFGKPGRVGLVGGITPIDLGIRFAQRHLHPEKKHSLWSHALIFQGERVDGQPWVIESDLEIGKGQFRNGVQENRVEKYADAKTYPNLAVLDFGLDGDPVRKMLTAGLDLTVRRTRYAIGRTLKTYLALLKKKLDREEAKDETYCSSLVRALFHHVGIDLVPGIAVHHTTPEHIARTTVPHTRHVLVRHE